jgi:hypothetical protein
MIYKTARMSQSIKIVTVFIVALASGLIMGGFYDKSLMVGGVLLGMIILACYLLSPASYELANGCLTIALHAGKRSFGQVVGCTRCTERLPFTLRLFGNGGLFGSTGLFWNRQFGIFRAFVTSGRHEDAVFVQTKKHKVLITPEDPRAFVEATQILMPPN